MSVIDVADLEQIFAIRMESQAELLLDLGGQAMPVGIMQLTSKGFRRRSTARPMRPAATVPTCMPSRS